MKNASFLIRSVLPLLIASSAHATVVGGGTVPDAAQAQFAHPGYWQTAEINLFATLASATTVTGTRIARVTPDGKVLLAIDNQPLTISDPGPHLLGYVWEQGNLTPIYSPVWPWIYTAPELFDPGEPEGESGRLSFTLTDLNDRGEIVGICRADSWGNRYDLIAYEEKLGVIWPGGPTSAVQALNPGITSPADRYNLYKDWWMWGSSFYKTEIDKLYIDKNGLCYGRATVELNLTGMEELENQSWADYHYDVVKWEDTALAPTKLTDNAAAFNAGTGSNDDNSDILSLSPNGNLLVATTHYTSGQPSTSHRMILPDSGIDRTLLANPEDPPSLITDAGLAIGFGGQVPSVWAGTSSPSLLTGYFAGSSESGDILPPSGSRIWLRRTSAQGDYYIPVTTSSTTTFFNTPVTRQIANGLFAGSSSQGPVLRVPASLAVDEDRDGIIHSPGDATGASELPAPGIYRIWVNDDVDRVHTFEDSAADTMLDIWETEEDDIGPEEAHDKLMSGDCWTDNRADSKRDLEDFFRLQLYTAGLNEWFRTGQLFLGLKWTNVTGEPAIRVYKQHDATGSLAYLTDETEATAQAAEYAVRDARYQSEADSTSLHAMVYGSDTFIFPASFFANLTETNPNTHMLFEVVKPGKGQLKLVILKQTGEAYTEIGEGPGVWFDFKKITDMYEQWSVGNDSGGTPAGIAGRVASETGSSIPFSYTATSPEEQKYILYVHGWNVEKWEKERFAETAYKRLWWQGYKGRFGLFTWPCTNRFDEMAPFKKLWEGVVDGTNYDRGEWSALRSGAPLRQLLQTLNSAYEGEFYVFSHSMGGVVTSEALRLQSDVGGGRIARVYVASQAALSAHLYDGTLSTEAGSTSTLQWEYDHPKFELLGINPEALAFGPQTPNIYKNWFAYLLSGSATSSSAVGKLVSFYNQNDYALAAPAWQFNQLTKPDWRDAASQPWNYGYEGNPASLDDLFYKKEAPLTPEKVWMHLGTRSAPQDRYEIMAFAAESYVKAFGATDNITQGASFAVNLRGLNVLGEQIWPTDVGDHKAHTWHSKQFRSNIQRQRMYWKTLLGADGFQILTTTLP